VGFSGFKWSLPRLTLKNVQGFVQRLATDESGQSTVEYILILSVCVVGASQLGSAILRILDNGILRVGGQLEKDLKTGRAPLHVWSN
jgi:Flp pilus assembly pilin Flp